MEQRLRLRLRRADAGARLGRAGVGSGRMGNRGLARRPGRSAAGGARALSRGAAVPWRWVRRQPRIAPGALLARTLRLRLPLGRCGSSELSAPSGGRAAPSA